MQIDTLFKIAEMIGIAAFAVSGTMIAIERGLDIFGVLFLSLVTALGGGVLRDLFLGNIPPRMFYSYQYLLCTLISSLVFSALVAIFKGKFFSQKQNIDRIINIFDAIGLGMFTVTGVQMTIDKGFTDNAFLAVFMGMTTGIGGGILRDMMTKEKPMVFVKRIYATAAILGGVLYYVLWYYEISHTVSLAVSVLLVISIRLLATYYRWNYPKVVETEELTSRK